MTSFVIILAIYLIIVFVSWCTHKFFMQGLRYLHSDLHQSKYNHIFARNVLFFAIFVVGSIILFIFRTSNGFNDRFLIGLGIFTDYIGYCIVYDIIIHQRCKLFRNNTNKYLVALWKIYKVHHKHLGQEDGKCFGMLLVPFKYFKI